jgi:hypothetical protein
MRHPKEKDVKSATRSPKLRSGAGRNGVFVGSVKGVMNNNQR